MVPGEIGKTIDFGDWQLRSKTNNLVLLKNIHLVLLLNDASGEKGATLTISWNQFPRFTPSIELSSHPALFEEKKDEENQWSG